LFRESVAAGHVPAMYALGLLLVRNPEFAKLPDEAVKLLTDSADAGIWRSSMILGAMSRDGREVPVDARLAYFHFRVAALKGGDGAKMLVGKDLSDLSQQLGPALTLELDSQAESWYRQHHVVLEFVYRGGENRTGFPNYALAVPENGSHTLQMLPHAAVELESRSLR